MDKTSPTPEKHIIYVSQFLYYHVFIDFSQVFDKVSHEALWATNKTINITRKLIDNTQSLYEKRVPLEIGFTHQSKFVRDVFSSSTIFDYSEYTMTHATVNHNGTITIGVARSQSPDLPMILMVSYDRKTNWQRSYNCGTAATACR